MKVSYTFSSKEAGGRLDKVLVPIIPAMSLRARRRLIKQGFITTPQTPILSPGYKVQCGEKIIVSLPHKHANTLGVTIINSNNDFIAISKPPMIHTESLSGGSGESLQDALQSIISKPVILLNRLDEKTSGIVVGACTKKGAFLWEHATNSAQLYKNYLAIVEGDLASPMIITNKLHTANTIKTKILSTLEQNALRHTKIKPLITFKADEAPCVFSSYDPLQPLTLVHCQIQKGARHQIRAHLAGKGYPLAGDHLYGGNPNSPFFLHNYKVFFPEFSAQYLPNHWENLPKKIIELIYILRHSHP